jgi:hypothetical protein
MLTFTDPEGAVGTSIAGEFVQGIATSGLEIVSSALEGARYPACGGPEAVE